MLDRIENMDLKLIRKKFHILDRMSSTDRNKNQTANLTINGHFDGTFGAVIQGRPKRLE